MGPCSTSLGVLLAHHVQVPLEDDGRRILPTEGALLADHHVPRRVLGVLQALALGEVHHVLADDPLVL